MKEQLLAILDNSALQEKQVVDKFIDFLDKHFFQVSNWCKSMPKEVAEVLEKILSNRQRSTVRYLAVDLIECGANPNHPLGEAHHASDNVFLAPHDKVLLEALVHRGANFDHLSLDANELFRFYSQNKGKWQDLPIKTIIMDELPKKRFDHPVNLFHPSAAGLRHRQVSACFTTRQLK